MNEQEVILMVSATYDLAVQVGDSVRQGDRVSADPEDGTPTAPVSGTIRRIDFDPAGHEFVVVIAPEA